MRKIMLLLVAAISYLSATAQTPTPVVFDVQGFEPFKHYTDAQMRATFGEPTRYDTWDNEFGGGREYQYGPVEKYDLFRFQAEDGLVNISIKTPRFAMFGGRIRIGDPISKMNQLGGGLLQLEKPNSYRFYESGNNTVDEWIKIETDSNGIIQKVAFVSPI